MPTLEKKIQFWCSCLQHFGTLVLALGPNPLSVHPKVQKVLVNRPMILFCLNCRKKARVFFDWTSWL